MMEIKFEEDKTNGYLMYFAISTLQVYKGKIHEELMWCEITPMSHMNTVKIVWEDDFYKPEYFDTLELAKAHIIKYWHRHSPYVNGAIYNND